MVCDGTGMMDSAAQAKTHANTRFAAQQGGMEETVCRRSKLHLTEIMNLERTQSRKTSNITRAIPSSGPKRLPTPQPLSLLP